MATKNNFDVSSSGVSIEASIMYDTDMSRINFAENFDIIQHSSNRKNSVLYYTDNVNVKNDIEFNVIGPKSAMIKYLVEQTSFDRAEISSWDYETMRQEIFGYMSETPSLVNYESLNEYDLKDTGLEIAPNKDLVKVVSRGYSPGDYAEIYYCPADLLKVWGNLPDQNELKKTFDNLLWDSPVWARITVNGTDYDYYECPQYDEYEFKRDEFLQWVSEKSGVALDILEPIMPTEPRYY